MLELAQPWALALLPLPLLVLALAPPIKRRLSAIRMPFFRDLVAVSGATPRQGPLVPERRLVDGAIAILMWLCIVGGLARPELIGESIEHSVSARDLVLAVDISESMNRPGLARGDAERGSRLDVVKRVLGRFIESSRDDRLAVIVFGSKAYVQVPFTQDLGAARALLDATEAGMAGPHTALGDAIGLAIRTFESSRVEQRLLILLTDGADTGSRMTPLNAAEIARRHDIRIMSVGVGDPAPGAAEPADFAALKQIAQRTGGQFFQAGDEHGLAAIYAEIDALSPREVEKLSYRPRRSLAHWPAGLAVCLGLGLAAASWLSIRRTMHA